MFRRPLLFALTVACATAFAAAPASADDDWEDYYEDLEDYYEDLADAREDFYEDQRKFARRSLRRGYYAPPVVAAPRYYAPSPYGGFGVRTRVIRYSVPVTPYYGGYSPYSYGYGGYGYSPYGYGVPSYGGVYHGGYGGVFIR